MKDDEKLTCQLAIVLLRGLDARLRLRCDYDPLTYDDPDALYRAQQAAQRIESCWRDLDDLSS